MSTLIETPTESPPILARLKRFSVEEYLRLVDANAFRNDDRFELLEGWILSEMTRNPAHDVTIDAVNEALRAILPKGWRLRIQSAIMTIDSVPEPDLAIVRGEARDFLRRHPGSDDVALVVEVADSSLAEDRTIKHRIYARAGIPTYWIVNIVDSRIEMHTDPNGSTKSPAYRSSIAIGRDGDVPLVVDGREIGRIAVRDLLP